MTEPRLIQRQREIISDLHRLAAERARVEVAIVEALEREEAAAASEHQAAIRRIEDRFMADKARVESEFQEKKQRTTKRFEAEHGATQIEYEETLRAITDTLASQKEKAKGEYQEACWSITTVFDAAKANAESQFNDLQRNFGAGLYRLQSIQQKAKELLRSCRQQAAYARVVLVKSPEPADQDLLAEIEGHIAIAEGQLTELYSLFLPNLFRGVRLFWLLLLLWLLLAYPCWMLVQDGENPNYVLAAITCTVASLVLGTALAAWLYWIARGQLIEVYQPLRQALFDAENLRKRFMDQATATYQKQLAESKTRRDNDLRKVLLKYRRLRADARARHDKDWGEAERKYPHLLEEMRRRRDADLTEAEERYGREWAEIRREYETSNTRIEESHRQRLSEARAKAAQARAEMTDHWRTGLMLAGETTATINAEVRTWFPAWEDTLWNDWRPSREVPPVLRLGSYDVDLAQVPHGLPSDPALIHGLPMRFTMPSLVPFPDCCSVLFKVQEGGRSAAVHTMQCLMMRLLTCLPPGKVRFIIMDPVGLGENFAAFMHLADHDEQLVTGRIWTEQQHIEQRLADLTVHMETVIQKYLRNQFQTIEQYNAHAGEVAEPFRILVVANFPVNFSIEAARRLVSIVNSGPRCGVYTLISVDTKQPLPQGLHLAELERSSTNLIWEGKGFKRIDPDFSKYPPTLDRPPDAAFSNRILRVVGEQAKAAKRVEVPFEFIAPTKEEWWTSDSRAGIHVPLGRAGATKRQHLRLGQGTAQHVLIAGKTGSGKSTLLHALITNVALCYSPEEIELYLVDFKKGVEFKTYATHELPHARVVAIESEREFGLSVLQRLDGELRRRADRFRSIGAQDVAACRRADPETPLPRILLVVDEFQEFFVEDDKIAQESALVLDRLVRQGRAFGIHVLLGSQTLGGAYTLARSTIDQMAVRIALQCSETDAHLILSEDNSAARLLSRPGEAIYNDQNGLVEGNNPFQVVWLDENRREDYLQHVQELVTTRRGGTLYEQIVFEGNAPASVRKNPHLHNLLNADDWPVQAKTFTAWLGEAIAIKDATAAVFRPQSGCNLLILGQDEDAALGMMTVGLVGLATQHLPDDSSSNGRQGTSGRFYVLDGMPPDSRHSGIWSRLASTLPHTLKTAGWRDLGGLVSEVADEVERRLAAHESENARIYLFVYGLQRFRDLRRDEDDFSFSRAGEDKPNAAKQFASILRDGPAVGVHVLAWCDTFNNLTRTFDRATLREFELRVLFQMGAGDSSNLIDSPLASKLGMHRALFFSEEQGRAEKFRPYAVPTPDWLEQVRERLAGRPRAGSSLPLATST